MAEDYKAEAVHQAASGEADEMDQRLRVLKKAGADHKTSKTGPHQMVSPCGHLFKG
jgi:hypothetical protein